MLQHIYFLLPVFLFVSGCISINHSQALTVDLGPVILYGNEQGESYCAQYGSLSDGSLHFVKVTMPDGRRYTLPQVVSASGVRYTDDRELVWWAHQGEVQITTRNNSGDWHSHQILEAKTESAE